MQVLCIHLQLLCMYYCKYYVYTCNLSAVPAKPVLTSAATSSKLSLVEATLGRRSINTQLLYLFDLFSTFLFIYIYQISSTYVWIHGDRPLNIGPEWGINRIEDLHFSGCWGVRHFGSDHASRPQGDDGKKLAFPPIITERLFLPCIT